jgi:hypothetical protein
MLKQTLLLVLLSSTAVPAAGAEVAVNLTGIGSKTCAYWLSGQSHQSEGVVWIYGFWSGLNYVAAASEQDQSKTTGTAIVAAVDRLCRREPSRVLAAAAWSAYVDLQEKNKQEK